MIVQNRPRLVLAQHRVVEPAQDRGRRAAPHCGGADRVAREGGDRGGLGALSADVADHRDPLVLGDGEEVVEVAADLGALARRRGTARRVSSPAISGRCGGSSDSCSVRAIADTLAIQAGARRPRRRPAGRAPRRPRAARRRAGGPRTSAVASVITPSRWPRMVMGTLAWERIPICRSSSACSGLNAARSMWSAATWVCSSERPVRATAATPDRRVRVDHQPLHRLGGRGARRIGMGGRDALQRRGRRAGRPCTSRRAPARRARRRGAASPRSRASRPARGRRRPAAAASPRPA